MHAIAVRARNALVWAVTLMTLGSGFLNLYSVMRPSAPAHQALFTELFPLEFLRWSKFGTLLAGFVLVVCSLNIFKRKKRAFQVVLAVALLSFGLHIVRGRDSGEAVVSLLLAAILFLSRKTFTVESRGVLTLAGVVERLAIAAGVAIAYGAVGFWLLDRREFGIDFGWTYALRESLLFLSLKGEAGLVPATRYARWFLDSLYLISGTSLTYAAWSVFQPVVYRFSTAPQARSHADRIVKLHGRSAQDHFKTWPDKSFYFSDSGDSFLAYRVGANLAIVLGDPVGPAREIEPLIKQFAEFCRHNDWGLAFHQALPDFLPLYRRLGFKKLKIGDDAIVDLHKFTLDGKSQKALRSKVKQFEKSGVHLVHYEPPVSDTVLAEAKRVSDEWLEIPGRRERSFTLGMFDFAYLRSTPMFAARDGNGCMLGFVNVISSSREGEATIDLMRRRTDAPNGLMDYLLTKLFLDRKEEGFATFNLGMAPMAGFREHEDASPEERAIHYFFQHLNFLFSFTGIRSYKAKFATRWEPRYVVYRNPLDLPLAGIALGIVSTVRQ